MQKKKTTHTKNARIVAEFSWKKNTICLLGTESMQGNKMNTELGNIMPIQYSGYPQISIS